MRALWFDIAAIALLTCACCAPVYWAITRALYRAVAGRQLAIEKQLNLLATTVSDLRASVSQAGLSHPAPITRSGNGAKQGNTASTEEIQSVHSAQETLAVIAAASTMFLGRKVQLREAHQIQANDGADKWSHQGRVIVQTSHNLRSRG
jgi:hypothetical protein